MAMLLGAARALATDPGFAGTVRFIFQPAEEGLGGARAMLADGLFERFPCDEIYAVHNCDAPLGQVIVHHGPMAAAADSFEITLSGRGGHAAEPHRARNPLPAAARLLLALESLPGRVTDARLPCVLTVAALNAGSAFNVIPDTARLSGTVRALDEDARATLEAALRRQAAAIADAEGLGVNIDYRSPFPVTRNTHANAEHVIAAARELFGAASVSVDPPAEMGSEDFGFMLEERPGCCFLLGQGDAEHRAVCHDTAYDFNDRLLEIGAKLWVRLVERRLGCG
jgi:hippurate hydrolase